MLQNCDVLRRGLWLAFHGVDLILHAGDIYIPSVLDHLERIAPVLAASGDDDNEDVLADKRAKTKHVLRLEGQTLWLGHVRAALLVQRTGRQDQDEHDNPNIVVFGHEHQPVVERSNETLYVNPGSPTFLYYRRGLGTIGILTLDSGQADVRIIWL
jgi:putative phosphoesterase